MFTCVEPRPRLSLLPLPVQGTWSGWLETQIAHRPLRAAAWAAPPFMPPSRSGLLAPLLDRAMEEIISGLASWHLFLSITASRLVLPRLSLQVSTSLSSRWTPCTCLSATHRLNFDGRQPQAPGDSQTVSASICLAVALHSSEQVPAPGKTSLLEATIHRLPPAGEAVAEKATMDHQLDAERLEAGRLCGGAITTVAPLPSRCGDGEAAGLPAQGAAVPRPISTLLGWRTWQPGFVRRI